MHQKLKEIKELCDKATVGPWSFNTALYTSARIWVDELDTGILIRAEEKIKASQAKK